MARTKTTAQKSRGGRAPRKAMATKCAPYGPGSGRMPEVPSSKRSCVSRYKMGTETYTIVIGGKGGTEEKEFIIHSSAAFAESSALGQWCILDRHQRQDVYMDANTGHLCLSNVSVDTFTFIFEYLYTKTLSTRDIRNPDLPTLLDVWKLADYLEMSYLLDFTEKIFTSPNLTAKWLLHSIYNAISHCYHGTHTNSRLGRWISALFGSGEAAFDPSALTEAQIGAYGCDEFWFDCAMAAGNKVSPRTAFSSHAIYYDDYYYSSSDDDDDDDEVEEEDKVSTLRAEEKANESGEQPWVLNEYDYRLSRIHFNIEELLDDPYKYRLDAWLHGRSLRYGGRRR